MSFLLPCPACGTRPVDEFRFGGEFRERPREELEPRAWRGYLYERANLAGPQREWWYHRMGCKQWFIATRDTTSNTVLQTDWLTPRKGGQNAQAHDAHSAAATGDDVSVTE